MILVLSLWIFIFISFIIWGFSVATALKRISRSDGNIEVRLDEAFFIGFITLSAISGILSVFIPLDTKILIGTGILTVFLLLLNLKEIHKSIDSAKKNQILSRWDLVILAFFIIFILASVANKITLGDTESYHAQSIQWVRKFAVVPGLGNIHGRLAFNSMFLVISGLFSYQIKDILILPLNGICYVVLSIKLYTLFKKTYVTGTRWLGVFYILTLLISLLILLPDLNSPSTDIICSILIIYAFVLIMNKAKDKPAGIMDITLVSMVVICCITFKISSLFLILVLFFLYRKEFLKRIWITVGIGIIILSSFIIRNYYLSGYLIYPFPGIDIFNADWKIPFDDVLSMKLEIASWAKISTLSESEVIGMKISEWVLPWFGSLTFINRIILVINSLSVISLVVMLVKKDYFHFKILLIVLINLIFWFLNAPDPRFAYGFLFLGFALNIAYLLKYFENSPGAWIFYSVRIGLGFLLILIICKRIILPVNTLLNPVQWIHPASFGTVETNDLYSDFHYRVPVPGGGCFNVEIPCVPFPLSGVVLRGKELQDGFKVITQH